MESINKSTKSFICWLIRIYQLTRIIRPCCCRFYPSCSDYTLTAIDKLGLGRGLWQSLGRLSKCHPWHKGGVDALEF